MRITSKPRQLPCVGSASNWQGQPYAQLQLPYEMPSTYQSVVAMHASSQIRGNAPEL